MAWVFANSFSGILPACSESHELIEALLPTILENTNSDARVLEGPGRIEQFSSILSELVQGRIQLAQSYQITETLLPRSQSPHSRDNRVFPKGWGQRLVRYKLSKHYSKVVAEHLLSIGETICYVPRTSEESPTTACSIFLAGELHSLRELYELLLEGHQAGATKKPRIPNHPHCSHVIAPKEHRK